MALILQREITLLEIRIIKRCTLRNTYAQQKKDIAATIRVLLPFQRWQRHDTCDTCDTHLTTLLPPPRDAAWMSTIHPPSVCDVRLISANSAYKVTSEHCSDMSGCHSNCCFLKISHLVSPVQHEYPNRQRFSFLESIYSYTHTRTAALILWLQI